MPLHHSNRLEDEHYRWVVRSIGDAVVTTNLRRVITSMNPAAESMTGWAAAEAVGRSFGEVFVLEDEADRRIEDPIARVVADGRVVPLMALTVVRRSGVKAPAAGSGAPLRLDDGAIVGAVVVLRDVSSETRIVVDHARLVGEAERLRQEVARTGDARDELFAMLGHELRNPLAPIVSTVELVRRRVGDSVGRELAVIERNVDRLVRLVDEFEANTRAKRGWGPNNGRDRGRRPRETTEFIALPALARTPSRSPKPVNGLASGATTVRRARRVLIVDDNADAAETMAESLSDLGVESHVVFDAESALALVLALKPTIAILDIGLLGIDGHELARRLKKLDGLQDIVLIALTGFGQTADRTRARAAGFDAHVVKPITASNLLAIIATLEDDRSN